MNVEGCVSPFPLDKIKFTPLAIIVLCYLVPASLRSHVRLSLPFREQPTFSHAHKPFLSTLSFLVNSRSTFNILPNF